MKKRIFTTALALTMCMSSISVFAESTLTAEELLAKQAEYMQNAGSSSMDMTINLDGALETSDGTSSSSLGMVLSGDISADILLDPMQVGMNMSMNLSLMGASQDIAMEMYMVENGTKFDTYQKADDGTGTGQWMRTQIDMSEMFEQFGVSSIQELQGKSFDQMLPEGMEIDWAVEKTDDTYELSASVAFSDLMDLIETTLKSQGEDMTDEDIIAAETILNGFVMNMSYTLDKETYATEKFHADFNDSDLSLISDMINEIMGESTASAEETEMSMPSINLVLNDFSIDGTYSYDTVTEIEIPADALTAEVVDVEELEEMAEDAVE